MDDAPIVGGGERPRGLRDEPGGGPRRQGTGAPDDRREVLALDQLHDDVRAGRIGAVVVDRDDARVVQRRGRLRFVPEAVDEVRVGAVLGTQDLDGDVALELVVAGAVDGGHPALPEQLDQAVPPAEDGADVRQASSKDSWVSRAALGARRASYRRTPPATLGVTVATGRSATARSSRSRRAS